MNSTRRNPDRKLLRIYQKLMDCYGPRHWWPAASPFEVMVGAVLTQNTAWANVERAIANLKAAKVLNPRKLLALPEPDLAKLLRPSGYFNLKAERLRALVRWYVDRCGGRLTRLKSAPLDELRIELLGVHGVGRETADSILCYAAGRPTFVIDAYTKRIYKRLGYFAGSGAGVDDYETMRRFFMERLPEKVALYNEYHALIVHLGNTRCRPRAPRCAGCPLARERHVPGAKSPPPKAGGTGRHAAAD